MAAKRIGHPALVTLLILTDADIGLKVAVNSRWIGTFTEGDRKGTTAFWMKSAETLTVE